MNYQPETVLVRNLKLNDKVYLSSDIINMFESLKTFKLSVDNNGEYTEPVDISPLSVIAVNKETYNNIAQTDKVLSNALYLVESDCIDAYGHTITNVAAPVVNTDAANKQYVDEAVSCNQHAYIASECYTCEKLINKLANNLDRCYNVQWSEFVLAEYFDEMISNIQSDVIFVNTIKLMARTDFPTEIGPVYAEIVKNPGNETDITNFIPVDQGRSLNSVMCAEGKIMTFNFDNVQLNVNARYAIKFVNDVGVLQTVNLMLIKDQSLSITLKTAYKDNYSQTAFADCGLAIPLIGISNSGSIAQSLIMPDSNTKNLYAVCIENGKLVSKKL